MAALSLRSAVGRHAPGGVLLGSCEDIFERRKTMSKHLKLRALTEGAIMIAMAQALSYLKLFELPNGGSISIGMLPIFVYCARWGWKSGFIASFAYGILQLVFDGAYAWGPWSMLLDYILAFGALGVAGFFSKAKGNVFIGTVVGSLARFVFSFISGVTIYRIYEPTEVLGMTFLNPYLYSFVYNFSYIAISAAVILVIFAVAYKPMKKYFYGEDLVG